MKLMNQALTVTLLLSVSALQALGQAFSSGSTGSYGPINVTADTTLDMPGDGIFNCTTIAVAAGKTLKFRRNALNTPVVLLASGDVSVQGTIDLRGGNSSGVVGGDSGPGGFDGGSPASLGVPPGAGFGPGGGKGGPSGNTVDSVGAGSYGTVATGPSAQNGATYGSPLLIPIVGGSGGGGSSGNAVVGGGGGGGGLLISSSTKIQIDGTLACDGGGNFAGVNNGGSGGAIRLVAPVVAGIGSLRINGNNNGGSGRVRIDALNRSGIAFNYTANGVTSIGSLMTVFPSPNPRLDIIQAAGTAIPQGSGPVLVQLPFGSSPNRTITVQAKDFNDVVPITVQLTPDNGTPIRYQAQIDNKAANPAQTDINVTLPLNVQVAVHVWTR